MKTCEAFATRLRQAHGTECTCHRLDLQSRSSTIHFARSVVEGSKSIGLLVNNAATANPPGIFVTNFTHTALLTNALLPLLGQSGRILNVSSSSHLRASFSDCLRGDDQSPSRAYAASKLALLLFSHHLQCTGHEVIDVHPGLVWTPLLKATLPAPLRSIFSRIESLSFYSPSEAANLIIHATTERPRNGHYITHRGQMQVSHEAANTENAEVLMKWYEEDTTPQMEDITPKNEVIMNHSDAKI